MTVRLQMDESRRSNPTPALSQTFLDSDDKGVFATIQIGKDLDMRLCDDFLHVIRYAKRYGVNRIVIDLQKIRRIFDSGRAMLMMLYDHAWFLDEKIHITNCRPEIRSRLSDGILPDLFTFSSAGYGSAQSPARTIRVLVSPMT